MNKKFWYLHNIQIKNAHLSFSRRKHLNIIKITTNKLTKKHSEYYNKD